MGSVKLSFGFKKKCYFLISELYKQQLQWTLFFSSSFFLKIEKLFLVGSLKSCLGNKIGFP